MITTCSTFEIDDACVVLPDPTWFELQLARATATDPGHIARLTDRLYEWLGATDRIGTVLDDRDCLHLFREVLEFESPDFDTVTVPVFRAEEIALRYQDIHEVRVVKISAGHYLLEMDDWADLAAASTAA